MANTKATLLSVEDAGPPPEKPYDQMTPEEQRGAFVRKVMAQRAEEDARNAPKPKPELTPRQKAQIEAEMARGAEVSRKHEEALRAQRATPQPPPDPREGSSTPVFRPDDYVPNMSQGKKASSSARASNV